MKELKLADHAELWFQECGNVVPERETPEWNAMYAKWIGYAFADFPEAK